MWLATAQNPIQLGPLGPLGSLREGLCPTLGSNNYRPLSRNQSGHVFLKFFLYARAASHCRENRFGGLLKSPWLSSSTFFLALFRAGRQHESFRIKGTDLCKTASPTKQSPQTTTHLLSILSLFPATRDFFTEMYAAVPHWPCTSSGALYRVVVWRLTYMYISRMPSDGNQHCPRSLHDASSNIG